MQRANATAADGIVLNDEVFAEIASLLGVEDGFQSSVLQIADGRMKEAGPDGAVDFNHG